MSFLKKCLAASSAVAVALTLAMTASAHGGARRVAVSMELVGQVMNPSPTASYQYGYVAYLDGLPIFNAGSAENESTARLSFFTDTTTLRVTNNGPLRVISRDGTVAVYDDPSANGNFANPDSFRDGTPILVARLRQQVVINTLTGAFTTLNVNRIVSTTSFELAGDMVRLGRVGQQFRTFLVGQVNAAPPPAAHIAGYTIPAHRAH
jgi:hypothetical protein